MPLEWLPDLLHEDLFVQWDSDVKYIRQQGLLHTEEWNRMECVQGLWSPEAVWCLEKLYHKLMDILSPNFS